MPQQRCGGRAMCVCNRKLSGEQLATNHNIRTLRVAHHGERRGWACGCGLLPSVTVRGGDHAGHARAHACTTQQAACDVHERRPGGSKHRPQRDR